MFEVSGRQYPVEIIHAESGDSPDDPDKTVARVVECMHEVAERHPTMEMFSSSSPVNVRFANSRGNLVVRLVVNSTSFRCTPAFPVRPAEGRSFRRSQANRLSTNVAETSLTVPGIRVVIDSGLVRINRFSARRGINRLPIEGVSIASANQRAGRAGRVASAGT